MRILSMSAIAASALLLGACGSVEYKDTNAEVDARPECEKGSLRPGETVPPWCEREQSATWSSGRTALRAEWIRDFTVPSGTPSRAAISL